LSAELTKTHSFGPFFWRFFPLGTSNAGWASSLYRLTYFSGITTGAWRSPTRFSRYNFC